MEWQGLQTASKGLSFDRRNPKPRLIPPSPPQPFPNQSIE